ncbi:MAG: tryptophan--tRNA ligase, partial [Acidilobaceae archaeon]
MAEEFIVTPWEVKGRVDYEKLISIFGTQPITRDLLRKIEDLAGELHVLLRRGVFFSHRDLDL